MGLDIEKTQEELNKKIAQTIDTPLSEEPKISEGGLSAGENQNLKNELSGEVITPGFSAQEAEDLTNGLSGEALSPEDSIILSKPDETEIPVTEQADNIEPENIQDPKIDSDNSETTEEPETKKTLNEEIKNITFSPDGSNLKEYFSKLTLSDFRLGIGLLQNIEQINIIRLLINEMNFSKAEKLMLLNECTKQQGIIQNIQNVLYDKKNDTKNNLTTPEREITTNDDEKIQSKVAFELYKSCKTPAQRDLAKFIINNKKLYIFDKDNNLILKNLFEKQATDDELKGCKEYLELITTEPTFQADDKTLNEQGVEFITLLSTNNIKEKNSLLLSYLSNEPIDKDLFFALFKNCQNKNDIENLKEIISYNKNDNEKGLKEPKTNYIREYLTMYSYLKELKNEELIPVFTELLAKVLINKDLSQNVEMFEFIQQLTNQKEIKPEKIHIIKNLTDEYNNKPQAEKPKPKELCKACKKIHKNDNYVVFIKDFLAEKNENKSYKNPEHEAVVTLLEKDKDIYSDFTTGRAYTDENLQNLFEHAQVDYKKDLLKTLCKTSSFSADNILTIMDHTPYYAINITKKILNTKNLTAQQKADVIAVMDTNREITSTVEKILNENNLDMSTLPKLLDPTKIHELEKKEKDGKLEEKKNDDILES